MNKIIVRDYQENLGAYTMPEGAEDLLRQKNIEEQMAFFQIYHTSEQTKSPYTYHYTHEYSLIDAYMVKELIVRDGMIVGVMMSDATERTVPCFVGQTIRTWDAEDDEGDGYKARIDDAKLLFIMN